MIRNQDDWLTGQIDTIIKLLAQLYFQDSKAITCLDESEKRSFYQEAMTLMEKQAYQQLNQLLLEKAETRSKETLKLALHICDRFNRLSDEELEKGAFSHNRLYGAVQELEKIYTNFFF